MDISNVIGYSSFVLGGFAVLVAVLIGWQIFTLIDMRSLTKRIAETENKLRKDIDARMEAMRTTISIDALDIANVVAHATCADMEDSICLLLDDFRKSGEAGKGLAFIYAFRFLEPFIKIAPTERVEAVEKRLGEMNFSISDWDDFCHQMTDFCKDNPNSVDSHSCDRLQKLILKQKQQVLERQSQDSGHLS